MNKNEMYDALDASNRSVIDQLVQNMFKLQEHSQREFSNIQYLNMIKNPERKLVSLIIKDISEINFINDLNSYKKSITASYGDMLSDIGIQHDANMDAIKNNIIVRQQITDLMEYIGIRKSYETLSYSGLKQKVTKHDAGYLSDLDHSCKVDDRYKEIQSTLQSEMNKIDEAFRIQLQNIKNSEYRKQQMNMFFEINKKAIVYGIKIQNLSNFIQVKAYMLGKADQSIESLYIEKIESGEYSESEVAEEIIFNNHINLSEDLINLLKFDYSHYIQCSTDFIGE